MLGSENYLWLVLAPSNLPSITVACDIFIKEILKATNAHDIQVPIISSAVKDFCAARTVRNGDTVCCCRWLPNLSPLQLEVATLISTPHIRTMANQFVKFNITHNVSEKPMAGADAWMFTLIIPLHHLTDTKLSPSEWKMSLLLPGTDSGKWCGSGRNRGRCQKRPNLHADRCPCSSLHRPDPSPSMWRNKERNEIGKGTREIWEAGARTDTESKQHSGLTILSQLKPPPKMDLYEVLRDFHRRWPEVVQGS